MGGQLPDTVAELCGVQDEAGCANTTLPVRQNYQRNESVPLLEFVQTLHFLPCPSGTPSVARYFGLVFFIQRRCSRLSLVMWYLFSSMGLTFASFFHASVQDGLLQGLCVPWLGIVFCQQL